MGDPGNRARTHVDSLPAVGWWGIRAAGIIPRNRRQDYAMIADSLVLENARTDPERELFPDLMARPDRAIGGRESLPGGLIQDRKGPSPNLPSSSKIGRLLDSDPVGSEGSGPFALLINRGYLNAPS